MKKQPPADITYNPYKRDIPETTRSDTAAARIASSGGGRKGQKSYANHREADAPSVKKRALAALKKVMGA